MRHATDKYRADIDGLRAVAVLAVILFHAGVAAPGGFVGVDVFFVISGFLITGLIAADLDHGRFSLARFWERRIRRIVPASLTMTVAVLAAGWVLLLPMDFRVLANDAGASLAMLANVRFLSGGGYFAPAADVRPLLHTWSLAVEEQFYVLLPLLMMLVWKLGRSRIWRFGCCAALCAASLAASAAFIDRRPEHVFALLPYRAWELLCGGLIALGNMPPIRARWLREWIGGAGLALVVVPCMFYDRTTRFPGLAALPPCLGAGLILIAGTGPGGALVNRWLAARPLVTVGRMSYSLYLWHWPILAFLRYCLPAAGAPPAGWLWAALPALAACSYLSWRFVETPCRRPMAASSPGRTAAIAAAAVAAVAGCCLSIRLSDGVPGRFSPPARALMEPYCIEWSCSLHDGSDTVPFPPIGAMQPAGRPCFMLWGDSHGMAVSPVIDDIAKEMGVAGVAALDVATAPLPGVWQPGGEHARAGRNEAQAWSDAVARWMRRYRPRHLMLCARWSMYLLDEPSAEAETRTSARERPKLLAAADADTTTPAAARAALQDGLRRLLSLCDETGTDLWVLLEVPYQPAVTKGRVLAVQWSGRLPSQDGVSRPAHERRQAGIVAAFRDASHPRLHVVDLAEPFFEAGGMSRIGREGAAWYADQTHVTPTGAREVLGPMLREVMRRMAADCAGR